MDADASLIGLRGLPRSVIESLLDRADALLSSVDGRPEPVNQASPAVVGLVFLEDSTRTRCSFETAVHRLGHRPVVLTGRGSWRIWLAP